MKKITHSISYYTNRINTLIDKVLEIDNSNSDVVKQCESIKKNSLEIMDIFTNSGKSYHRDICKIALKIVKQVDKLYISTDINGKQSKIIKKIYSHLDGLLYRINIGADEYAYLKLRLDTSIPIDKVPFGDNNATENSIHYISSKLADLNLIRSSVVNLDKYDRYYWDMNELSIPGYKKHVLARLLLAITNCAYDADTDTYDFGWDFRSVVNALTVDKDMVINTMQYASRFDYDIIAVNLYNGYLIMTELD